MSKSFGVHWFRRDLRIAGNAALQSNWLENEGRVIGLFAFDAEFLSRPDFSVNRFQLFINTLENLRGELRRQGGDLLFYDVGPEKAFDKLFKKLKSLDKSLPSLVTWSQDYEPYSRQRDKKITQLLVNNGVKTLTKRDHLIFEPGEVLKGDGTPYRVFTPFRRQWIKRFKEPTTQLYLKEKSKSLSYFKERYHNKGFNKVFKLNEKKLLGDVSSSDILSLYRDKNNKRVTVDIPAVGPKEIYSRLLGFEEKINKYGDDRDIPSIEGTSKFAMFLKNGSLTSDMIINFYNLSSFDKPIKGDEKFFNEIIWREFYYHILYYFPEVEKKEFVEKYRSITWSKSKKNFELWKEGKTGFPIVDAGMRQLKTTGWMHNRVRMIVASFLTKDLHINWRWGEQYFMETLLDGDVAPNNGGWQWAASTGVDPQPYFRIFNPWSQGERFDKEGEYIKKYIPELSSLPSKELHKPILNHNEYPKPMVDHSDMRRKALIMYKSQG